MRKLFELGQFISFRVYSEEIDVSDRHHLLNDAQLQAFAQMVWGADVTVKVIRKIEVVKSTKTIITTTIDSSAAEESEYEEQFEHILIKKVE